MGKVWRPVPRGRDILLIFRPSGTKRTVYDEVEVGRDGWFTYRARATRSGTWRAMHFRTRDDVEALSPMDFVQVR